ncbi:MAG: outer membrane beta-barrel protein [Chitinophagaceae bacterium]|nr:outer membrane beta-barrel protein [Chitinophagaceae bacterium]
MKLKIITLTLFCAVTINSSAQLYNEYVQQGEVGITAGAAHYFGDLNTRASLNRPKPAFGIFFRKQFGNYVGLRISAHYAQVGYSDVYSKNDYQKRRNLSFNSNIWELAVQGDFNFFKFMPGDPDHLFTPYVTLGAGVFSYDPYAYLNGNKEFLRPLGTEGQLIQFQGRKQYSTMAICFPLGVGVKYNITDKINVSFEVSNRFTTTDYLDDVSTTYIGADKFPPQANNQPSVAQLLQDRSFEIDPNNILGIEGRQRGFSKQKDQYIIAEIGVAFNLSSYRCPSPN